MGDEAAARKDTIADVFGRVAVGYGAISYFPKFGKRLVEFAQVPAGAKVLDVACGRGAILFPTAERVGPAGSVMGIDLSAPMAQETQAEIDRRGLKHAQARQMDAENLEFPDASFDMVLCGFALQFFPQLQRALSEFRRVLVPGGRVGVTTWGDNDPRWDWWDELCTAYGAKAKLSTQPLDKPDDLRVAFSEAGFTRIEVTTEEADWILADEDEWWATMWSISGRAGLEKLSPPDLEKFKADVYAAMQPLREPDGFHNLLQAHFTLATNP